MHYESSEDNNEALYLAARPAGPAPARAAVIPLTKRWCNAPLVDRREKLANKTPWMFTLQGMSASVSREEKTQ